MSGLGKGLGALLSNDGRSITDRSNLRKELDEKRRKLQDVLDEIEVRKTEVEKIRTDLTIKLLLEEEVDKTYLFEKEEKLKTFFDEKEILEIAIERLEDELHTNIPVQQQIRPDRQKEDPPSESNDPPFEIDISMVRDLMFDEDEPLKNDDTSEEIIIEDEEGHISDLKRELDGTIESEKVRREAYGVKMISKSENVNVLEDPIPTNEEPQYTEPPQPMVQSHTDPRKVKVVIKRKIRAKNTKDARFYSMVEKAQYHLSRNDLETAKEVLHGALRDYPLDDELLYHLGNVFFLEGDLDSAEVRFRKAIRSNDQAYRAFNNLGIVFKKKGERESAIQAFNQSLEINDSYERAWLNLGMVFMELDPPMLNEARVFFRRALECGPSLSSAKKKLEECEHLISQRS